MTNFKGVTATAAAITLEPHDDGSATLTVCTVGEYSPHWFTFHLDEHVARSLRLAADWVGRE